MTASQLDGTLKTIYDLLKKGGTPTIDGKQVSTLKRLGLTLDDLIKVTPQLNADQIRWLSDARRPEEQGEEPVPKHVLGITSDGKVAYFGCGFGVEEPENFLNFMLKSIEKYEGQCPMGRNLHYLLREPEFLTKMRFLNYNP